MNRTIGVASLLLAVFWASGAAAGLFGPKKEKADGVCGVPGLVSERMTAVKGRGNCGIAKPVLVTGVAGVALSEPSIMTCGTAKALDAWVRNGVKPAVGERGGGIATLTVVGHYSCRTRNNKKGARLSEHARGHAIDVSRFIMRDGSYFTVLNGWRKKEDGALLREIHEAACGPFGTVLGPNADRYHQDHFHFDIADRRSGPICR